LIQPLYELILNAVKNNEEKSKLLILEKFRNTINYYARKLNYYCAKTDLILEKFICKSMKIIILTIKITLFIIY